LGFFKFLLGGFRQARGPILLSIAHLRALKAHQGLGHTYFLPGALCSVMLFFFRWQLNYTRWNQTVDQYF